MSNYTNIDEAGRFPFFVSLKKDKSYERRSYLRQSGLLATVPFLLAVPPVAGVLIGRFLDQKFNTDPILTIIFLILGFIAGAKEVASVIKKATAMEKRNEDKRK